MYFIFLLFAYVTSYIIGIYWWRVFVGGDSKIKISFIYIGIILGSFFASMSIILLIPNGEIANRVQHALAGGAMMTLIGYLSYGSSGTRVNIFALGNILFLIAMTFGVFNELAESILQLNYSIIFAPSLEDTWYDMWANTLGAFLGSLIIIFFEFQRRTSSPHLE